jgi:hypothetical protein
MESGYGRRCTLLLRQLFQRPPQTIVVFFAMGRAAKVAIQKMSNQPNLFTAIMALQAGTPP